MCKCALEVRKRKSFLGGKALAPSQSWIGKQVPEHLASWSLEQPDVSPVLPIVILPTSVKLHVSIGNGGGAGGGAGAFT